MPRLRARTTGYHSAHYTGEVDPVVRAQSMRAAANHPPVDKCPECGGPASRYTKSGKCWKCEDPDLYKVYEDINAEEKNHFRNIPPYAIVKGFGRCRVLGYGGNNSFWVLDQNDEKRRVKRDRLTFLKH